MKKLRKRKHLSNEGFSLMELIVTMMVSLVVTAAVAGFLSAGMRYYQNADNETRLQTESQVAELFLTELLQEAVDFKELNTGSHADISYAFEVKRRLDPAAPDAITISVVAVKGEQLWYAESVPDGSDADKLTALVNLGMSKAFLANHVTTLVLTPGNRTEAIDDCNGLVKMVAGFQVHDRTYTETSTVSLRNKKKN